MGLFSAVSNFVTKTATNTAKAINTGGGLYSGGFFTPEGQKERINNAIEVVKQSFNPVSPVKPQVNTSLVTNKTAQTALKFVADNPYTTALAVAVPASSAGRGAVASTIGSLSTKGKVILGTGALLTTGAVATSEKSRVATIKGVSSITPESIVHLGGNLGNVIENPNKENLSNLLNENKLTAGVLAGGLLLNSAGQVAGALTTYTNTQAVKENTKVMKQSDLTSSPEVSTIPSSGEPPTTKKVKKKKVVKKKRKKKHGGISTKYKRTKRKRKSTHRKNKRKSKRGKK